MVVVDRMKIGFMVEDDESPLSSNDNQQQQQQQQNEIIIPSMIKNHSSPSSSPKPTSSTTSSSSAGSGSAAAGGGGVPSLKYEEDDEDGVMILSTFATSPTPSPAVKPMKIPSINSLAWMGNPQSGNTGSHQPSSSSSSYQSHNNNNPNLSYQTPIIIKSDPYQLSPRKVQYTGNGAHSSSSPQQMHASGGMAIPNFSSFLNARQQMDMSHGSSPKLDSVRTTPTGSVGSSPFITPRGGEGHSNISPPSSGMLQPLAGIAEEQSSYSIGGSGSPPRSPCSDDDLVICGENPDGSPAFGPRSMACDKHSKWKKRCPDTCVGRVSPVEFPTTTRPPVCHVKRERAALAIHCQLAGPYRHLDAQKIHETDEQVVASSLHDHVRPPHLQADRVQRAQQPSTPPKQHPIPIQPLTPNIKIQQQQQQQHQQHQQLPNPFQQQQPQQPTSPSQLGGLSFQASQSKFKKPIGRPAESCIQHRTEHQKCPKDCPYRPESSPPTATISAGSSYQHPPQQPAFKVAGLTNI
ncbi:hypothetical protein DFA_11557 [Cavenderia fasciculata]|uniref:Uncharacterized protein n=1 Tax=Cavenderia fasciculata TaxID=261658 RepID=F4QDJ9_CACFS|nr:uncharacterized protein DFA_11557 [Cavenderia fasciculata]EGG13796.1 hypothetical protein DFA_11557 [Cavenderia fasciculata]|eukprot:XP_004350504.1 hypothetical protein DFA_11557 [Cavenderia fasciculata]